MKKFIIIIFLGLLFSGSVFSQELSNCVWQLQNPTINVNSEMISFKNGRFNYATMNLSTKEKTDQNGSYQILGNQMTLTFDGSQSFVFNITWITPSKMALTMNGNNLFYAKAGTIDDQFMKNLIFSTNSGVYNSGYNESPSTTTTEYKVCYTCLGTGSCKVCGGTGTYSLLGYSNTCSACKGSGKCWHCGGSKKQ